ncbi:DUF2809 domain-containing protein [Cellulomonas sp. Leaf334]|uniref:ribosomal maturation YjgA family protein n=1 Tax=Cellulomonas sp. Leaf334 TaxID=1736339 RepID=UPI0006F8548B|nr:DUF2809 domain-containing protein [Cellulomonas sp. Leaf334]KQR11731.1 hypothetical protein ASF78_10875 [Cellulomonas sp. Leaf334]
MLSDDLGTSSSDQVLPTAGEPEKASRRRTSRVVAGLVAVGLVVLGVAVSRVEHPAADPVGDALYAAFVFTLLVVVAPRARSATLALLTVAFCAVIELAQLTGVPAAIVDAVPVARYALGTTFVAVDLLAYAVGAGVALVVRR